MADLATSAREQVRMRLVLEVAVWRHGWIWLVTLLVVLCAAGGIVFVEFTLQREGELLAQQRAALASAQDEAVRAAAFSDIGGDDAQSRVRQNADRQSSLASIFMPHEDASDEVRRLYELAGQQQIVISQAEYRSDVDSDGVERVQVRMPAKATYPQLRRFAEASLRALPNASLDSLTFRRNQVGDPQIEAQVNFSLWLQGSKADESAEATSDVNEGAKP